MFIDGVRSTDRETASHNRPAALHNLINNDMNDDIGMTACSNKLNIFRSIIGIHNS